MLNTIQNINRIREQCKRIAYIYMKIDTSDNIAYKNLCKQIDNQTFPELFENIPIEYALFVLKNIASFLSAKNIAIALRFIEQLQSNMPYQKHMTTDDIQTLYRQADKKTLMSKQEYDMYMRLPDTVVIYRGVNRANKNNKTPLIWTLDKAIAYKYAIEIAYDTEMLPPQIYKQSIKKEQILCYREKDQTCIVTFK